MRDWRYRVNRRAEAALLWLVWRLPRGVVYWATVRCGVEASSGRWGAQEVPTVTVAEALTRWRTR